MRSVSYTSLQDLWDRICDRDFKDAMLTHSDELYDPVRDMRKLLSDILEYMAINDMSKLP